MNQIICSDSLSLTYYPNFLSNLNASYFFDHLFHHVSWQQETYNIFGKKVSAPRLIAWYGDNNAFYQYSGITHHPLPWTELLLNLKSQIEQICGVVFNGVLLNLYRNGQDSMGWHADNESELGSCPTIASLSLGSIRKFSLRHNSLKHKVDLELNHGSLLVMNHFTQHYYKHAIPKSAKIKEPRINLTFRLINYPKQSKPS